jgi:hypothetical protein
MIKKWNILQKTKILKVVDIVEQTTYAYHSFKNVANNNLLESKTHKEVNLWNSSCCFK